MIPSIFFGSFILMSPGGLETDRRSNNGMLPRTRFFSSPVWQAVVSYLASPKHVMVNPRSDSSTFVVHRRCPNFGSYPDDGSPLPPDFSGRFFWHLPLFGVLVWSPSLF